jgi:hypothetical protein
MMLLSTAAIGVSSVVAVSSASAADVEKKMAWSGQVNRMVLMGDDGEHSFVSHGDNNGSGSRARVKFSAASDAMTIGGLVELAIQAAAKPTAGSVGTDGFSIRHSMIYFKNSMGKLDIGETSHAGESFTGVDVSGTGGIEGVTASAMDGLQFNDSSSTPGTDAAGPNMTTAYGGGMGSGRLNGVSYSTPSFNGFGIKVSHRMDESGSWEGTYGGDFNGVKVKAGYSFAHEGGGTYDSKQGGGVGITLPSGLNFSATYRQEDLASAANTANNDDPETMYGKIGYTMSGLSDLGKTNIAVAYRHTENQALSNDDFKSISLLVNQNVSDYGTSIYGGYTNASYDTSLSDFDDIDAFWMGVRVTF